MGKKVRVGIIGFGGIANAVHLPGYRGCQEDAEIVAVCDIDDKALQRAATALGLPEDRLFKSYKDLIASDFVDAVDICTPNDVHCEIANEAIKAGKPFSVEKPIGLEYGEALTLYENAQKAGVPSFVCFSWRYRQHTRYLKHLIDSGEIGKLHHIYIRCIKDSGLWEGRRLEWRFDKDKAGTGVLGDLGSHMIDITRFLGEEFVNVSADCGIIIDKRQKLDSDEIAEVTTDDWCNIIGRLKSNIGVTIALSRVATTIDDLIEFELFGEKGTIKFKYQWSPSGGVENSIEICAGSIDTKGSGRHNITPPESFASNQSKSFVDTVKGIIDPYAAQMTDGLECQKVLDAALLSVKTGRTVNISEIGAEVNE